MNTPIKATDVAKQIYSILIETVEKEFPNETEEEKREIIFDILTCMSYICVVGE